MKHASSLARISPLAPPEVAITDLTKRFGALTALDAVSLTVRPGTVHALLGENGAGKSTLVKCLMGTYRADGGQIRVDGAEMRLSNPREAQKLGLGMVYQHFTLVPSMSVAENLVLGEEDMPAVIDWPNRRKALREFMDSMPFRLDLDRVVSGLSAGEKQKLEILKQLHLGSRFLILDEPTSVLTPDEADQILGLMRDLAREGRISVVLISHKLREVETYADEVTVLRGGKRVGQGQVSDLGRADMVRMMVGEAPPATERAGAEHVTGAEVLRIDGLSVDNDRGVTAVRDLGLAVRAGEVLGIAGVSGNGQTELVEALAGQRDATGGAITVDGKPFHRTRAEMRDLKIRLLPEDPLRNACVRAMSVAENLSLRSYDEPPFSRWGFWLDRAAIRSHGEELIARFHVKTQGPDALIGTLSGGNVQRTVLARELSEGVRVLIVQNPCFGLDLKAVAEIRSRILAARDDGAAVLLISEDLDEILELSDRIAVMSQGRLVHETPRAAASLQEIGRHMAAH
ncbi:nucleoside ABC transporter ATP-binding protein [Roseivivax lentus]|uniref:Nucleoside ABC transporter ATP-binding protein n=1 Tax=Roseivivax lentus TaxID=633194 RepID=A0A1N7KB51_9RHOB|nr:ABC transporter ATP-binding protein [Roseivivax lentus]SIS58826.1 nucleoside ABC transporter ATP-binding protein [Roseivivax lentus]